MGNRNARPIPRTVAGNTINRVVADSGSIPKMATASAVMGGEANGKKGATHEDIKLFTAVKKCALHWKTPCRIFMSYYLRCLES